MGLGGVELAESCLQIMLWRVDVDHSRLLGNHETMLPSGGLLEGENHRSGERALYLQSSA